MATTSTTKLTPAYLIEMREMWEAHYSVAQIAAATGYKPKTITNYAGTYGWLPRQRADLTADEINQVAQLYQAGVTLMQIAQQLQCCTAVIVKLRKKYGWTKRKAAWTEARIQLVKQLYEAGYTQSEIAAQLGSSQARVGVALKRAGVTCLDTRFAVGVS